MRAIIQRVSSASVSVSEGEVSRDVSRIGRGLLVLVGVAPEDSDEDLTWMAGKVARLRIFPDEAGLMNRSVVEVDGGIIAVSQFTLFASTAKGNRPAYLGAAKPELARPLYEAFCVALEREAGRPVGRGVFGGDMRVALVNEGPVTIAIDSRRRE